jgi:hypothetical protein
VICKLHFSVSNVNISLFQVLNKLIDSLDSHPVVTTCVCDFEAGIWQSIRLVLPEAHLRGCIFHFTQALWRKVQAFGLVPAYNEQGPVYRYIRRMMALPFLPAEQIRPAFDKLATMTEDATMLIFVNYIEATWMRSTVWPVANWSCFLVPIRTNNDCEGWHRRLNQRAERRQMQLYVLAPLLHQEAQLVGLAMVAVCHCVVSRYRI